MVHGYYVLYDIFAKSLIDVILKKFPRKEVLAGSVGCPIFGLFFYFLNFFFYRGVFFEEKRRSAIHLKKKISLGVPVGEKPQKVPKTTIFGTKKLKINT
ncbi:Uncharacterized protein APZ42_003683 [Daphnia magna]|uniref:Uncharacterized protein n=1 Tax=Daphnia magna TaxID=35525 RepID=A0A168EKL6_9CRUS|nr:Uncharacterized protein APZ42_003683 [Daphnia magna]